MTIESRNPNKPQMLCYGLVFANKFTSMVRGGKGEMPTEGTPIIVSYNYSLLTNDEIPEDKFKEIETAIALIMNPNLEIPEQGRHEPTK